MHGSVGGSIVFFLRPVSTLASATVGTTVHVASLLDLVYTAPQTMPATYMRQLGGPDSTDLSPLWMRGAPPGLLLAPV